VRWGGWALAFLLCGGSARADEDLPGPLWLGNDPEAFGPPPPGYHEDPIDGRIPAGLSLMGTGVLFIAGGAALYSDVRNNTPDNEAPCVNNVCPVSARGDEEEAPPIGMMTGGAAAVAFGAVLLGHAVADPYPYFGRGPGRTGAGMFFTGLGAATTLGGIAVIVHGAFEDVDSSAAGLFMFVPAAAMLGTGVPLWLTGSRPPPGGRQFAAGGGGTVLRSPTIGSAGVAMLLLGFGGIGSSIAIAAADAGGRHGLASGQASLATAVAGGTLVTMGSIFTGVGFGQTSAEDAWAGAPRLQVGAGSAHLSLTY
jgi:hypothetical protein